MAFISHLDEKKHIRSTTVIAVRHRGKSAIGADGQVTLDDTVIKTSADKLRELGDGKVVVGFAGGAADALTLFDRFEDKLKAYPKDVRRAAVELAKDWRLDRALRRLEALLVAATKKNLFLIGGNGDIIEPDDGVLAVGSGAPYATAAARALIRHCPKMSAGDIVSESLKIASEICIYTNEQIRIIEL
ncbi:MAG: ATP-dependent protease subunit HslV [Candidatus Electryonea clarkiae]|nr:ATP-dependent protease subunit HslV [Candidatus Electryonea clarkiae]MDP8288124.1 ATP-dependent protease subunit HslV [Candidatus Electryonea clarkiae]